MTVEDVTAYIEALEEPKRSTLNEMRRLLLEIEPEFEQVVAWRSAQFKLNGQYVAGICAHKKHMTYSPHSQEVMSGHESELAGYVAAGSSFQFAIDQPLPIELIASLVMARKAELA